MFNSRINQMVLGAGAMQSAGLKNITAKHIALASQSIALIQALLPYMRINMAELSPPGKATLVMKDFDRLSEDLGAHQQELRDKLLAIMADRASKICQRIESIDWDATDGGDKSPAVGNDPSRPMADLVKDTITLHKVLSRFYPPEKVQDVLTEVVKNHSERIAQSYGRLALRSSLGKRRLLFDARFFITRLAALDSVRALGNQLEVAANNIRV
ncbi:Vps54-like protein-domain-containing protein [Thamnocephalis sphaerospora]|uniref:Vps54-like protein-domain-containing protein n=1 Tax=Thamnocephalis sphaerospora TaxID=78915 RepID=A0A4P9XS78_9FUNG|nr:Vps54-like protein-domain-containing protein [Thamnocephalis sphaerospora]|eukprot:RKP08200.1 Vps54-like protein-domain-containing protein [Thamnocephalis sphaerospora]